MRWLAAVVLFVAACRSSSSADAAAQMVDSSQPLVLRWGEPWQPRFSARAVCKVPERGVRATAFDAFGDLEANCSWSPLNCTTLAARESILSKPEKKLPFPNSRIWTTSDDDGFFSLPLEPHGLLLLECEDESFFYVAGDVVRNDPTTQLKPTRHLRKFETDAGMYVVNPWTRRVAHIDGATWGEQPESLVGFAWATTLDDAKLIMTPSDDTPWGPKAGFANMFAATDLSPTEEPIVAPVNLAVRVTLDGGLEPRTLELSIDGAAPMRVRSNGADLSLDAGVHTVSVSMMGALPVDQRVEVTSTRRELKFELSPAPCGNALIGGAVAGAKVFVNGRYVGTSEADGRFAFTDRDVSSPCTMSATHPSFGVSEDVPDAVPAVLRLHPLHDARLRPETPDGGSVPGMIRVYASKPDAGWVGTFEEFDFWDEVVPLGGIADGPHTLLVLTAQYEAVSLPFDTKLDATVKLTPRPTVQGVVRRGGAPVEGVRVKHLREAIWSFSEDETVTDAQGRFTVSRSLPGDAELSIGGQTVKVKFPSTKPVTVKLQP